MLKRFTQAVAAALGVLAAGQFVAGAAHAGVIVVGHDTNTLASSLAGANEAQFAVNLASFLTAGEPGKKLLLMESGATDVKRNFAPVVLNALTAAGFNLTVTTNYATPLGGFDAVFTSEKVPPDQFLNNIAMINFVNNGGGIYLAGGSDALASSEAAGWKTFLNHFGLAFDSTSYDGISGTNAITSTHPIFNGVPTLESGIGSAIISLGTNPNAQVVQSFNGKGVYAVVQPALVPTPEPASLALLGIGGLGVVGFARRARKTLPVA